MVKVEVRGRRGQERGGVRMGRGRWKREGRGRRGRNGSGGGGGGWRRLMVEGEGKRVKQRWRQVDEGG